MNCKTIFALLFLSALGALAFAGSGSNDLADPLKPFAPFVGKTWKGEFANSTKEKPVIDVARWERALNGKAVRVLHSINDGQYGGETLIVWDAKQKSIAYWYFTTAGFRTEGTMKQEDGQMVAHEIVAGSANGVSEVKSTTKLLADGKMRVTAHYLKEGKWTLARDVTYSEAPNAKVTFK